MTALAVAESRRDAGMHLASEAEAAKQPGFKVLAYATILRLAREQATVHTDDVLAACPVRPRHPNAWGAVWMQAIREGIIEHTGETRHSADPRKNKHLYPVYRSLVQERPATAEAVSAPTLALTVPIVSPPDDDLQAYHDFIAAKRIAFLPAGLSEIPPLNPAMFPHQRHGVEFALRYGRAALFYDTGLGKSLAALEWGRVVVEITGKPVLMLAPLAVGQQHKREADRFGIEAEVVRSQDEVGPRRIYITNYDRLDKFDPSKFGGVILDESSILKSFTGKTTRKLIEAFAQTPYRLCCTATPAPNDHTELGTHAEFLSVMRREEMLPIWFINDTADTGTWRIKGHARENFWSWVATWARCVSRPSDLGFDDGAFALPALDIHHHKVAADRFVNTGAENNGQSRLFRIPDTSATSIHAEKRLTIADRAARVAEIVAAEPDEPWVIWVDTDYEADAIRSVVPEAVEVRGSQSPEEKERRIVSFSEGRTRILLSKASVTGFGLNWQHCARQCFAGLSFSYEAWYQAVRRSWRFGQARPVHVHVVCADTERAIWTVIDRKAGDHEAMKREMVAAMRRAMREERARKLYQPEQEARLPAWIAA